MAMSKAIKEGKTEAEALEIIAGSQGLRQEVPTETVRERKKVTSKRAD